MMTEDTELELKKRQKDQELKQNRISFWVKDISVFIVALALVILIDFYSFAILQKSDAPEGEMRFAIASLSSTVIGLLSYMVGRASK